MSMCTEGIRQKIHKCETNILKQMFAIKDETFFCFTSMYFVSGPFSACSMTDIYTQMESEFFF